LSKVPIRHRPLHYRQRKLTSPLRCTRILAQSRGLRAVPFVFRAINFCALGALFLAPFWTFNSALDRLLPHPSGGSDHASAFRERILVDLANLKEEIRTDMCRRDAYAFCVFAICPARIAAGRCQQK
jgi:hypothetical protein